MLNTDLSHAFGIYGYDFDAMSSPFEVRRLLRRGGARVIGILRTMCHVITDVTANHRLSSRTIVQFAITINSNVCPHVRVLNALMRESYA